MEEIEKEDVRIRRSKKLLANALLELLEENPFAKISVLDVCEKASIRRATFYKHFESKDHLLEYIIEELLDDLYAETVQTARCQSVEDVMTSLIEKTVDFIVDNKEKILLIIQKNKIERISALLIHTLTGSLKYLTSQMETLDEHNVPKNILIDFFSGGIVNMGLNWILSPTPCTKEELLSFFHTLLNENAFLK